MGAEEFATCFANRTDHNLTAIQHFVTEQGAQDIHLIIQWWHAVPEEVRLVIAWLGGDALKKFLQRALGSLGVANLEPLILLLGAIAWGDLIEAMIHCESEL